MQEENRTLGMCGNRMYDYIDDIADKADNLNKINKNEVSALNLSIDEDGDEADEFFEVDENGTLSSSSKCSSDTMSEPKCPISAPASPLNAPFDRAPSPNESKQHETMKSAEELFAAQQRAWEQRREAMRKKEAIMRQQEQQAALEAARAAAEQAAAEQEERRKRKLMALQAKRIQAEAVERARMDADAQQSLERPSSAPPSEHHHWPSSSPWNAAQISSTPRDKRPCLRENLSTPRMHHRPASAMDVLFAGLLEEQQHLREEEEKRRKAEEEEMQLAYSIIRAEQQRRALAQRRKEEVMAAVRRRQQAEEEEMLQRRMRSLLFGAEPPARAFSRCQHGWAHSPIGLTHFVW